MRLGDADGEDRVGGDVGFEPSEAGGNFDSQAENTSSILVGRSTGNPGYGAAAISDSSRSAGIT